MPLWVGLSENCITLGNGSVPAHHRALVAMVCCSTWAPVGANKTNTIVR